MEHYEKLPEIPSEYIEPYLAKFMGSMVEFIASARPQEEIDKHGIGWTVAEVKHWMKGVEVFVSNSCGLHARLAMNNEIQKMITMDDNELYETCRKVVMGNPKD